MKMIPVPDRTELVDKEFNDFILVSGPSDPTSYLVWAFSSSPEEVKGQISVYHSETLKCKKKFSMKNSTVGCFHLDGDTLWVGALDYALAFDAVVSLEKLSCLMLTPHKKLSCTARVKIGLGLIYHLVVTDERIWAICQESNDVVIFDSRVSSTRAGRELKLTVTLQTESFVMGLPTDSPARAMLRVDEFVWTAVGSTLWVWDIASCECVLKVDSSLEENISALIPLEHNSLGSLSSHAIGIWHFSATSPGSITLRGSF
jgi:hypothetical protein